MKRGPDRTSEWQTAETIAGDRRAHRRYEVALELRYKVLTPIGAERAGFGTARNLSRGGVSLQSDELLPAGLRIELFVKWPFRLQNICPLDLVVVGQTIRLDAARTAVRTASYSFRTRGARFFDEEIEAQRVLAIG